MDNVKRDLICEVEDHLIEGKSYCYAYHRFPDIKKYACKEHYDLVEDEMKKWKENLIKEMPF